MQIINHVRPIILMSTCVLICVFYIVLKNTKRNVVADSCIIWFTVAWFDSLFILNNPLAKCAVYKFIRDTFLRFFSSLIQWKGVVH